MKLIETWRAQSSGEIDGLLRLPDPVERFLVESPALAVQYGNIKHYGDAAIREYVAQEGQDTDRFTWEVQPQALRKRIASMDATYLRAIARTRREIMGFHRRQLPSSWHVTGAYGEITGQHYSALERVAICLPRDWRFSPAGLMMFLAPARAAKVGLTYLNVPVPSGDGEIDPMLFWTARQMGVETIYKLPESAAVFAFAQGTESVPKVDKIVCQGDPVIESAMMMVSHSVGCKFVGGDTDTMIVADNSANASFIAADAVCLTEDPTLRRVTVITPSVVVANEVMEEISKLAGPATSAPRQVLDRAGAIILTRTLTEAVEIANRYPPKHLNLFVEHPLELLSMIANAGVIALGENTPAALDSYFASAGNLVPSSQMLRFDSPLEVLDFVKRSSLVFFSARKVKGISRMMETMTREEHLPLHSRSIKIRLG